MRTNYLLMRRRVASAFTASIWSVSAVCAKRANGHRPNHFRSMTAWRSNVDKRTTYNTTFAFQHFSASPFQHLQDEGILEYFIFHLRHVLRFLGQGLHEVMDSELNEFSLSRRRFRRILCQAIQARKTSLLLNLRAGDLVLGREDFNNCN